jgi:hypothetical protein
MSIQFSNGRSQLNPADVSYSVIQNRGNLSAQDVYLSFQTSNLIGRNYLIVSDLISVSDDSALRLTINSSLIKSGEQWDYLIVGVSTLSTTSSFNQIAKISLRNTPTVYKSFPITFEFTHDRQLLPNKTVTNLGNLPATNLVNGELVSITNLGIIVEYNYLSTKEIDNSFVFSGTSGRWLKHGYLTTYLDNINGIDGCRQDIRYITSSFNYDFPEYSLDGGFSDPLKIFIVNDFSSSIPSGTFINLNITQNGNNISKLFDKKIKLEFRGFVNMETGVLRTTYLSNSQITLATLNSISTFNYYSSNFKTPDTCEASEAISIFIHLQVSETELTYYLEPNSLISVNPYLEKEFSVYTGAGNIFADGIIYNTEGKLLIVPNYELLAYRLSGSAVINSFYFTHANTQLIDGFVADTANQNVVIDNSGNCFVEPDLSLLPSEYKLRALVSTEAGESELSPWSNVITLGGSDSNKGLKVTLTLPTYLDTYGVIRDDYDDYLLAGNSEGILNAHRINIYVKKFTEEFSYTKYTVPFTFEYTQVFNLYDKDLATVVTELPSESFGLFKPVSSALETVNGGNFQYHSEGITYSVAYSFTYNGNQITAIQHNPDDKVPVLEENFVTSIDNTKYWGKPVTISELKAIPYLTIPRGQQRKVVINDDFVNFTFYPTSMTDADDISVIRPNNILSTEPGRWVTDAVGLSEAEIKSMIQRQILLFG